MWAGKNQYLGCSRNPILPLATRRPHFWTCSSRCSNREIHDAAKMHQKYTLMFHKSHAPVGASGRLGTGEKTAWEGRRRSRRRSRAAHHIVQGAGWYILVYQDSALPTVSAHFSVDSKCGELHMHDISGLFRRKIQTQRQQNIND